MPATITFLQTSLLLWSSFASWVSSVPLSRRADCPGYKASNVQRTNHGITADLTLAGPACNLYSNDLDNLKFLAEYQTGMILCASLHRALLVCRSIVRCDVYETV